MMFKTLALAALVALTGAARITDIDGYPLEWLREPQPGTPGPQANFRPTPTPFRPLSMRTVYRRLAFTTADDNVIVVGGNGLVAGGVSLKLIAPDAADCTANAVANAATTYAGTSNLRQHFTMPVNVEYPHEHLMPWICVCVGVCGANSVDWIHTNMRYAVVPACDGDSSTTAATRSTTNNNPLQLCENYAAQITPQAGFGEISVTPIGTIAPANFWTQQADTGHLLFLERKARTKCCGWREAGLTDFRGNAMTKRWGVCINPLLENCCSRDIEATATGAQGAQKVSGGIGKPYSLFREKCCFGGNFTFSSQTTSDNRLAPEPTIISYLDDYCPCQQGRPVDFCNQIIPASPSTAGASLCCTKTKYPELLVSPANALAMTWGKCYDGMTMKCCDTGDLYDPGSRTCCKINGVQSINKPCPCSADAHCQTPTESCCQDVTRPKFPMADEPSDLCGIYLNYPNGTGPAENQPCLGHCIDTRFKICCNGASCIDEYEVCCNNTCCNKFNQRCTMGLRAGATGKVNNRYEFKVPYEVCTSVEGLTPFVAVQVFVVPLFLLVATFISLAATLFFAKRQSTLEPLSTYEKSMFALCCFLILFAWPFFFSPLYKYGVVAVWAAFFVMLAAMSQLRQLNIAALIVLAVLLVYLVDPFYGNELLTLAEDRMAPTVNSVHGFSGVLSALAMEVTNGQQNCIQWYNFFQRDPMTEDQMRWDNPMKTSFGFCSRGWYVALSLFGGIVIALSFLLFFVTLVTHIRNVLFEKAQKTDDIVGWH